MATVRTNTRARRSRAVAATPADLDPAGAPAANNASVNWALAEAPLESVALRQVNRLEYQVQRSAGYEARCKKVQAIARRPLSGADVRTGGCNVPVQKSGHGGLIVCFMHDGSRGWTYTWAMGHFEKDEKKRAATKNYEEYDDNTIDALRDDLGGSASLAFDDDVLHAFPLSVVYAILPPMRITPIALVRDY
jgi:hypothetical protein